MEIDEAYLRSSGVYAECNVPPVGHGQKRRIYTCLCHGHGGHGQCNSTIGVQDVRTLPWNRRPSAGASAPARRPSISPNASIAGSCGDALPIGAAPLIITVGGDETEEFGLPPGLRRSTVLRLMERFPEAESEEGMRVQLECGESF